MYMCASLPLFVIFLLDFGTVRQSGIFFLHFLTSIFKNILLFEGIFEFDLMLHISIFSRRMLKQFRIVF